MAISPKIVVFWLYDASTGAPLAGQTPVFTTYKDDLGVDVSQPAISAIGGGAYKFTPVFSSGRGIAFSISSGSTALPLYQSGYLRPEDYYVDEIDGMSTSVTAIEAAATIIKKFQTNRWKVVSNQLIIYDDDGTTPYVTFNLFDSNGSPTTTKIFERVPV